MKKIYLCSLALLTSSMIASCAKSNIPPPTPLELNPPSSVQVKVLWKTETGNGDGGLGNFNPSPAYANDTAFIPNQNGKLFALSIDNGKKIWSKKTGVEISSRANTTANAVIFGSVKGDLIALDTNNGTQLWHSYMPSSLFSQPTIYNSSVYTHTHDGSVSAYDVKDGTQRWNETNNIPEIMLPESSSPIVLNNTVMVGTAFGTVLGYTTKEGDRTINIPVAISHGNSPAEKMVDIVANPMLYRDSIIFASYQGTIISLDKDNGRMQWAKKSSTVNNMAINDNVIFTVQSDSSIKAFNVGDGEIVWSQNILDWRNLSPPIYYKGMIVVGDYQGYLHFFNSINGDYLGRYKLTPESRFFDYGIRGKMIPTEKGILIETDNGTAYLVDANSNKVIYDNILSDYTIDKGTEVKHIEPVIDMGPVIDMKKKISNIEALVTDFKKFANSNE